MLKEIHIENFVLVDALHLYFNNGFTVFTGETGVGKSILVDAVNLALGSRSDTSIIRQGANFCEIRLCFELSQQDYMVRRMFLPGGASRSFINDRSCTQQTVREWSQKHLKIYGQHHHHSLFKREYQQQIVDRFGHHQNYLDSIHSYFVHWNTIQNEINELQQHKENRERDLDILRYQWDELNVLNIKENEYQDLTYQQQRLSQAKTLIQNLTEAINLTVENDSASAAFLVQEALDRICEIKLEDPNLDAIKDLLNTAIIHLKEAHGELHKYRHRLDLSEDNLTFIESRLTVIYDIARKHRVHPDELFKIKTSLEHKIKSLENLESRLEKLEQEQQEVLHCYKQITEPLTQSRQRIAEILETLMTEKMQQLGMKGGQFKIECTPVNEPVTFFGNETISFLVSTNPGQAPLPLGKVVSGGELSRLSLALQVLMTEQEHTLTLIFDEIDSGIGGETARTVSQHLRELGQHKQIFCITHLPQIAAAGNHHFKVDKITENNRATTLIQPLKESERVAEIARMLSGRITPQTLEHAKSLLI